MAPTTPAAAPIPTMKNVASKAGGVVLGWDQIDQNAFETAPTFGSWTR